MLIAVGLIALAGVAYLWWSRRSSSASGTSPFSTGQPSDQTVPASSGDVGGGGAGAGQATDTSTSDLLSTLQAENQQLIDQLLGSQSALTAWLAAHPLGGGGTAPPPDTTPPATVTPEPPPAVAPPVPAPVAQSLANTYTGFTSQTFLGGTVYTPTTAEATVINASPNALRTIGSDAAQIQKPKPAPKPAPKTFLATHAAPR